MERKNEVKNTGKKVLNCFKCAHQYTKEQMKNHPCLTNIIQKKLLQQSSKITKSMELPGCNKIEQQLKNTESMELPGCNKIEQPLKNTESMKLPGCNKIEQPLKNTESMELPGCNKMEDIYEQSEDSQKIEQNYYAPSGFNPAAVMNDKFPCARCGQFFCQKRVKKHVCNENMFYLEKIFSKQHDRHMYKCKNCGRTGRKQKMIEHSAKGCVRPQTWCKTVEKRKTIQFSEIDQKAQQFFRMDVQSKARVLNMIEEKKVQYIPMYAPRSAQSQSYFSDWEIVKPKQMNTTEITASKGDKIIFRQDFYLSGQPYVQKKKGVYFDNSRLKSFKKPTDDAPQAPQQIKLTLIRLGCLLTYCLVFRAGKWRRKDKMAQSNLFIQYLQKNFPITLNYDFIKYKQIQPLSTAIAPYCGIIQGFIDILYPQILVERISNITQAYRFPMSLLLRIFAPRIKKFAPRARVQKVEQLKKIQNYLTKRKYKRKIIQRSKHWIKNRPLSDMQKKTLKSLTLTKQFFTRQYRRAMYSQGRVVRKQNRKLIQIQQNKLAIDWVFTGICNIMSANKIFRFFYRQQTSMDHVMRRNDHYYRQPLEQTILQAIKPPVQRTRLSRIKILERLNECLIKVGQKQRCGLGGLAKQQIIVQLLKRTGLTFQDEIDQQIKLISDQDLQKNTTAQRRKINIKTMSQHRKNTILSYLCRSKPQQQFQSFSLRWIHQYRKFIVVKFQKYLLTADKAQRAFPNSLKELDAQQIMNMYISWLAKKGLLQIQDDLEVRYIDYMKKSIEQQVNQSIKSVQESGPFIKFKDVKYISSLEARKTVKLNIQIQEQPKICQITNWKIDKELQVTPQPLYTYKVVMQKAIQIKDQQSGNYIACSNDLCHQWIERDSKTCMYCSSTYHIKCPVDTYRPVGEEDPCKQCQKAYNFSWMSVTWSPSFNSSLWKQSKQAWLKRPKQQASNLQQLEQKRQAEIYLQKHELSIWCRFADMKIVQSFNAKLKLINPKDMELLWDFHKNIYVFPIQVGYYQGKGNGLKAARNILKNELVAVYSGWIIPNSFAIALFERSRNKQVRKWKDYIATIFDGPSQKTTYSLVPHLLGNFGHLMNSPVDEKDANTVPSIFISEMGPVFLLKSVKDIKKGQQLQWFYNGRYNDYPLQEFK